MEVVDLSEAQTDETPTRISEVKESITHSQNYRLGAKVWPSRLEQTQFTLHPAAAAQGKEGEAMSPEADSRPEMRSNVSPENEYNAAVSRIGQSHAHAG